MSEHLHALTGYLAAVSVPYRAGRPIVLVARSSGDTGVNPRRLATEDLLEAATLLAKVGLDIRPGLPSEAELIEMLRLAAPVKSRDRDGKRFTNRFVSIDLRAEYGVYVVLSVGTGKRLDESSSQPFVKYLAETIVKVGACLVFARRLDRVARNAWALAPVMLALIDNRGFIGDTQFGLYRAEGIDSVLVFFRAQASEEEARIIPTKTRIGMRRGTGDSLSTGSCKYAVAHMSPPGMMTFRSVVNGHQGPRVLTFDTPSCRPDAQQTGFGLPSVFSETVDGEICCVDQVDNVRWLLARLGEPAWPSTKLALGLARRKFSTEGLRRTHGPDATYGVDVATEAPYRVLATILGNLDVYETGRLERSFGIDGFEPHIIHDCFPPDGLGWATPADFKRIRDWMLATMPAARRVSTLSGLEVTVNGTACLLIARTVGENKPSVLTAVRADRYRATGAQFSPGVAVILSPQDLLEPFVEAIAAAGDQAFLLVPPDDDIDEMIVAGEISTMRTRIKVLEDSNDAILAQVTARTDTGGPVITGEMLKRLNADYDKTVTQDIPAARAELKRLEESIIERKHVRALSEAGVATERLLALVAALRDPTDLTYRDLIKRTIRDVNINVTNHEAHKRTWLTYDILFTVRIATPHGEIHLRAHNEITYGNVFDAGAMASRIVDDMCAKPCTFDDVSDLAQPLMRREVAKHLGVPPRRLMLPNITDARIANLAARVLRHPDDIAAIAKDTGESETLLQRILQIHSNATRAVWFARQRAIIAAWYAAAQNGPVTEERLTPAIAVRWDVAATMLRVSADYHHWTHIDASYTLTPCQHCGSTRRTPARIPEPDGPICLDCELDNAGQRWPLATYHRYLIQ